MSDKTQTEQTITFAIDANVLIAIEPFAGDLEVNNGSGSNFVRLASEGRHRVVVHPAVRDDIRQDQNKTRRTQRLAAFRKYPCLEESPVPGVVRAEFGGATQGSNNERDMRLVAALHCRAATYLVTEDVQLHKRAARLALGDSVLSIAEAVALLEELLPKISLTPPNVKRVAGYVIDSDDPIFESLRRDYPEFDSWLVRHREDPRRINYIVARDGHYSGVAFLKPEENPDLPGIPAPTMKMCTFKVADDAAGTKYGELLLKAVLREAQAARVESLYVTVFTAHQKLLGSFLPDFGFHRGNKQTPRGEDVFVKQLVPPRDATQPDYQLSDLEFHIRFGPPALRLRQNAFVVPIPPKSVSHVEIFCSFLKQVSAAARVRSAVK